MRHTGDLPKEFLRAISVFESFYSQDLTISPDSKMEEVWSKTGNIGLFSPLGKLSPSKLSSGYGWRWSQAKTRRKVDLSDNITSLELFKLVPKSKPKITSSKPPSLRLWQFNVFTEGENMKVVLWCEKGIDQEEKEELKLSDFQFLASFMHPTHAKEFWPLLDRWSPNTKTHISS